MENTQSSSKPGQPEPEQPIRKLIGPGELPKVMVSSGEYLRRQKAQMESAYRASDALAASGKSVRST